jgi:hypothetical protein
LPFLPSLAPSICCFFWKVPWVLGRYDFPSGIFSLNTCKLHWRFCNRTSVLP